MLTHAEGPKKVPTALLVCTRFQGGSNRLRCTTASHKIPCLHGFAEGSMEVPPDLDAQKVPGRFGSDIEYSSGLIDLNHDGCRVLGSSSGSIQIDSRDG